MALSIGVSVGSKIDIAGSILKVRALVHPNLIVVGVNDGPDIVIEAEARKEVLPNVFVFTGIGANANRLAFEAPRNIRISRIEPERRKAG